MQTFIFLRNLSAIICMLCFTATSYAVDTNAAEKKVVNTTTIETSSAANMTSTDKINKKMVQEATINLQTTVTGNQEQPRVLYILPWQSPAPEDVDFEAFDNQQKAAFSHIEREELRRELDSANE